MYSDVISVPRSHTQEGITWSEDFAILIYAY